MDYEDRLQKEIVAAAKAQDKARLSTLRLIKTALHNRQIDVHRPLNETEWLQLLTTMVKQRKDSIEQFASGGRQDLVAKEEAELEVIQAFMPAAMSEAELEAEIAKVIAETGAVSTKDLGKVMKVLMPRITGRADGKAAGEKVRQMLSS